MYRTAEQHDPIEIEQIELVPDHLNEGDRFEPQPVLRSSEPADEEPLSSSRAAVAAGSAPHIPLAACHRDTRARRAAGQQCQRLTPTATPPRSDARCSARASRVRSE